MSFVSWLFTTLWSSRVFPSTVKNFEGKWVFVSLANEMDIDLLEIVSDSGEPHECICQIRLAGFTDDQSQKLRSSSAQFEAACAGCIDNPEMYTHATLNWDDNTHALIMELGSISSDPYDWFCRSKAVIPLYLSEHLKFDGSELLQVTEGRLRSR